MNWNCKICYKRDAGKKFTELKFKDKKEKKWYMEELNEIKA